MMKLNKILAMSALALASVAFAFAPGLKLTPGSNGDASAKWIKLNTGGKGGTNFALELTKTGATSDYNSVAGADIGRIEGTPVSSLTELGWTFVSGTRLGGSPRWNIYLDSNNNGSYDSGDKVIFLDHNSPGGADDNFTQAEIQANVNAQGGSYSDKILYLQIIVDNQHSVVLDDIKVGVNNSTTTFSGPGNSN